VPLLVTLHNVLAREAEKSDSWLGRIIASADWVSCVSASVLSATRKTLPSMASRSSVVYNGLDIPAVASQAAPADAPKLLCLGRLKIRKGFDVALKAFVSVVGRFPEARLIVAGDGPERLSLERQAVQLGIGGVVDFIGWVAPEDVPELVAKVTAVVMPSRHEPFGLVALDAALTSRPIVASRVGGLTEVVAHGKTGLLVEPNDSAALAEALVFLLDNRDLAVEMGRIARRRAQTIFSWKRCVDAYDELYQKLAHRAG
jgi:glycosyltransferase involved in cell wall biosynthesis